MALFASVLKTPIASAGLACQGFFRLGINRRVFIAAGGERQVDRFGMFEVVSAVRGFSCPVTVIATHVGKAPSTGLLVCRGSFDDRTTIRFSIPEPLRLDMPIAYCIFVFAGHVDAASVVRNREAIVPLAHFRVACPLGPNEAPFPLHIIGPLTSAAFYAQANAGAAPPAAPQSAPSAAPPAYPSAAAGPVALTSAAPPAVTPVVAVRRPASTPQATAPAFLSPAPVPVATRSAALAAPVTIPVAPAALAAPVAPAASVVMAPPSILSRSGLSVGAPPKRKSSAPSGRPAKAARPASPLAESVSETVGGAAAVLATLCNNGN